MCCIVQEWVIAENSEVDKKLQLIKQDAAKIDEEKPDVLCSTYDQLFIVASTQNPLVSKGVCTMKETATFLP